MNIVVLAMHGAPPNDFPGAELSEFFRLPGQLQQAPAETRPALRERYEELEEKLRSWPRTPQNDPYHSGSHSLAKQLSEATGYDVIVGFYEFCDPTLDRALEEAVETGAQKVIVVTPMTTRGGSHSERDIPAAIQRAKEKYHGASIAYVWPLDTAEFARFLAGQIEKFL